MRRPLRECGGELSPDVGGLGLQVSPPLVHVIQPLLQEIGLLCTAQGLHHLAPVAVHTFEDVIVGIDLRLDVLWRGGGGEEAEP